MDKFKKFSELGVERTWHHKNNKIEIGIYSDKSDGEQYVEVMVVDRLIRIWDDGKIVIEEPIKGGD